MSEAIMNTETGRLEGERAAKIAKRWNELASGRRHSRRRYCDEIPGVDADVPPPKSYIDAIRAHSMNDNGELTYPQEIVFAATVEKRLKRSPLQNLSEGGITNVAFDPDKQGGIMMSIEYGHSKNDGFLKDLEIKEFGVKVDALIAKAGSGQVTRTGNAVAIRGADMEQVMATTNHLMESVTQKNTLRPQDYQIRPQDFGISVVQR
ncbi:hypothetical protein [Sphingomonas sp.]|uniref:hypothetical protein n=1 Tax=Sphingomonas sp. TaxID=28214 RepID=UPI003CC532EA